MRLKKIKMSGFKSFVDPTELRLDSNLVAVVGPNGCGKSNTIDAVRWVMGESSAKHLRGESMADVIFNGSSTRKPVGQASVELVFDNSAGDLGGEYAAFGEISIKRVATRDGTSKYYLNGSACRRKDVTDIFLGTGLGPRSYAIIEQGMISRLVEAKPQDLRHFIEEAAGISKYKERRRETETRLSNTKENLDRLNDLRGELEKQVNHLKRQATAAEKYEGLQKECHLAKSQVAALAWQRFNLAIEALDKTLTDYEDQKGSLTAKLAMLEAESAKKQNEREVFRVERDEIQKAYYECANEIARLEQLISHRQEQKSRLLQDKARAESQAAELQLQAQKDDEKLNAFILQLSVLEPNLLKAQEALLQAENTLQEKEKLLSEARMAWESFSKNKHAAQEKASVARAKLASLQQQSLRSSERKQRLQTEKQGIDLVPLQEKSTALEAELKQLLSERETQEQAQKSAFEQVNNARNAYHGEAKSLDTLRGEVQALKGRVASLLAMQESALGVKDEKTSQFLKQLNWFEKKRLAQQITVAPGYEAVAELVLADLLDTVFISSAEVKAALQNQKAGWSISVAIASEAKEAPLPNTLANYIQISDASLAVLNHILVAENIEAALSLLPNMPSHQSVVTQDGFWISSHFLKVAHKADQKRGMLVRENALKEAKLALSEKEAECLASEQAQAAAQQILQQAEQQKNQFERTFLDLRDKLNQKQGELNSIKGKRDQWQLRLRQIQSEDDELNTFLLTAQEEIRVLQKELELALAAMTQGQEDEGVHQNTLTALERAKEEARILLKTARDEKEKLQLQTATLTSDRNALQQGLLRLQSQQQALVENLNSLNESLTMVVAVQDDPTASLQALLDKKVTIEQQQQVANARFMECEETYLSLESQRKMVQHDLQSFVEKVQALQLERQTFLVKEEQEKENLRALNVEAETILQNLPEDTTEDKVKTALQTIENSIARLGPVNLAAVSELAEASERKVFLDTQHQDLIEALTTLEGAIKTIDDETGHRFRETLDNVNAHLQVLFPRLFGGGQATLDMEGDDILDAGVSLMARPPGKRNSSIHLLSGGEKALTAVALVFSIFQLNPAPFCMLDEVDAPLDEANVGRYCEMVKAMSESVQFIYISHNKVAMEMAHHLSGVTMKEPGVSRLVSVNVEEAAEMAAS